METPKKTNRFGRWFWLSLLLLFAAVAVLRVWQDSTPDAIEQQQTAERARAEQEAKAQEIALCKTLVNAVLDAQMQMLTNRPGK